MLLHIILITLSVLLAVALLAAAYLYYLLGRLPKVKPGGIRIACVGDSITQGVGVMFDHLDQNSYPAMLQGLLGEAYQVLNYGHSGRTLLKSGDNPYWKSPFYAASLRSEPALVLIMLGSNDSKPNNWQAARYEQTLAELVASYRQLPGPPEVRLLFPPAVFVRPGRQEVAFKISGQVIEHEIIPILQRAAAQMGLLTIDIFSVTQGHPEVFPDGVHPNAAGDRLIAEAVYAAIKS